MLYHVTSMVFCFLALADEEGTSASSEQEEDEEVVEESSDDDNDEGYKPPSGKKQRTGSVVSLCKTITSYHTALFRIIKKNQRKIARFILVEPVVK